MWFPESLPGSGHDRKRRKNQRYNIMQATGCDELEAALQVAADLDKARGLPPFPIIFPDQPAVECQDE